MSLHSSAFFLVSLLLLMILIGFDDILTSSRDYSLFPLRRCSAKTHVFENLVILHSFSQCGLCKFGAMFVTGGNVANFIIINPLDFTLKAAFFGRLDGPLPIVGKSLSNIRTGAVCVFVGMNHAK